MTKARVHLPSATSLVARSANTHVIGVNNRLPWHLRTDLVRFRKRTQGHVVIMGRRTFDSIGKPLPNRVNVVLSRNEFAFPGTHWAPNLNTALHLADIFTIMSQKKDFFVIGGEQIYSMFLPYINKVFLTEVYDNSSLGDAKFDVDFDSGSWKLFRKADFEKSEDDEFNFSMLCYLRKKTQQRIVFRDQFLRTNPHLSGYIGPYIDSDESRERYISPSQLEMTAL